MADARILVLSDETLLAGTLSWVLRTEGYAVATAPRAGALDGAAGGAFPGGALPGGGAEGASEVVLLDLAEMTAEAADSAVQRVAAGAAALAGRVVALSPLPRAVAAPRLLARGAHDVVHTPVDVRELLARVRVQLEVRAELRRAQARLSTAERELQRVRQEAESRRKLVDILNEVAGDFSSEELANLLVRRVARALNISHCALILARPGDERGVVATAHENPGLRNLEIDLTDFPEVHAALQSGEPVLVEQVAAPEQVQGAGREVVSERGRKSGRELGREGRQDAEHTAAGDAAHEGAQEGAQEGPQEGPQEDAHEGPQEDAHEGAGSQPDALEEGAGAGPPVRSVIALPFRLEGRQSGVFLLRTVGDEMPLRREDVEFADAVVKAAVTAIRRARAAEAARADQARLQVLALTDPLTLVLNRRALMDRLGEELERARRYELSLSVLMLDIDHFKPVNDTYGHLAGDEVLRGLAKLLQREARSVDLVARYGGEEFVIVLPETPVEGAITFAERVGQRVAEEPLAPGEPFGALRVTVSVGVAAFPQVQAGTATELLARADEALYRAKQRGRNRVCL